MDITHEVFNQPDPLVNYNLFESNWSLRDALKFNAPGLGTGDMAELTQLGARLGTAEMQTHARLANVHTPELHTHDRFGRRIDQVAFHPSYHALMSEAVGAGLHGTPWTEQSPVPAASHAAPHPEEAVSAGGSPAPKRPGMSPHVLRAAGFMLFTELEPSSLCPISMTYAVTPALRSNAAVYADWAPKLTRSLGGRRKCIEESTFSGVLDPFPASKKRSLSDSERSKFFSEFLNPSAAQTPSESSNVNIIDIGELFNRHINGFGFPCTANSACCIYQQFDKFFCGNRRVLCKLVYWDVHRTHLKSKFLLKTAHGFLGHLAR